MENSEETIKKLREQVDFEKERADRNYEVAIFFENQVKLLSHTLQLYDGKISVNQFREQLGLLSLEKTDA